MQNSYSLGKVQNLGDFLKKKFSVSLKKDLIFQFHIYKDIYIYIYTYTYIYIYIYIIYIYYIYIDIDIDIDIDR